MKCVPEKVIANNSGCFWKVSDSRPRDNDREHFAHSLRADVSYEAREIDVCMSKVIWRLSNNINVMPDSYPLTSAKKQKKTHWQSEFQDFLLRKIRQHEGKPQETCHKTLVFWHIGRDPLSKLKNSSRSSPIFTPDWTVYFIAQSSRLYAARKAFPRDCYRLIQDGDEKEIFRDYARHWYMRNK